jgi:nucleotidyltransferase/DNA polymerase involved in DNA repair
MHADGVNDELQSKTTAQNPNFVADYFSASRLHFIGSFRARYESMMAAVAQRLGVAPATLLRQPPRLGFGDGASRTRTERTIVHVDMDAFFASVAARDNPELRGKPIAVCHATGDDKLSDPSARGGEISSCSYEARSRGVRAGMFLGEGRRRCPDLIAVPYDFPAYERVSITIYALFYSMVQGAVVQAQSVDEAYIDLTYALSASQRPTASAETVEGLVLKLRNDIYAQTGCRASAGIGPSRLTARIATGKAKPNGQLRIRQEHVMDFIGDLPVRDLPGIGWRTIPKLRELGVESCAQLRTFPVERLQSDFGDQTGRTYYELCRGIDRRPIEPLKPRKSMGAEVSWGVRFGVGDGIKATKFIRDMASEVAGRCAAACATGRKVTYKAYKKQENAGRPGKYLGHGPCDVLTRTERLDFQCTDAFPEALASTCLRIHASFRIGHDLFRGIGIQVSDITFHSLRIDSEGLARGGKSKSQPQIDAYLARQDRMKLDKHAHFGDGPELTTVHHQKQDSLQPRHCMHGKFQQEDGAQESGGGDVLPTATGTGDRNEDSPVGQFTSIGRRPENRGYNMNDIQAAEGALDLRGPPSHYGPQLNAQKHHERQGALPCAEWDPYDFCARPTQIPDEINPSLGTAHGKQVSAHRGALSQQMGLTEDRVELRSFCQAKHLATDAEMNHVNVAYSKTDPRIVESFITLKRERGDSMSSYRSGEEGLRNRKSPTRNISSNFGCIADTRNGAYNVLSRKMKLGQVLPLQEREAESDEIQPSKKRPRKECDGPPNEHSILGQELATVSNCPPCPDWDPTVFEALPTQIRSELCLAQETNLKQVSDYVCTKPPRETLGKDGNLSTGSCHAQGMKQEVGMNLQNVDKSIFEGKGFPATWDLNVFDALPTAIKRELVHGRQILSAEEGFDIPSPPSLSSGSVGMDDGDIPQTELLPGDTSNTKMDRSSASIPTQQLTEQALSSDVFRTEAISSFAVKLKQWMQLTSTQVRSGHVELLRGRLLEMVRRRALTAVHSELTTIRLFAKQVGGDWSNGFNAVLQDVQCAIKDFLGIPLLISPLPSPS